MPTWLTMANCIFLRLLVARQWLQLIFLAGILRFIVCILGSSGALLGEFRLELIQIIPGCILFLVFLLLLVGVAITHVDHSCYLRLYSLNTNRIEMIISGLGSKEEGSSKSATSLGLKDKRERLLKIEQKLEAITVHKQNMVRDQTEEQLTRRVLDAELRCAEEIKSMQGKVRELRESFAEMRIREGQLMKKCELSRRSRTAQLRDLQKRLQSFVLSECKERKDMENSLISIMERKDKELTQELARIKEARIEVFNRFEGGLSEDLPELGVRIQQRLGEVQEKLQVLHQEVRKEAETLRERMDAEERQRQKGMRSVYEMIAKLMEEIKNDMIQERKQRQTSRLKLLALFQTACGKLNLI